MHNRDYYEHDTFAQDSHEGAARNADVDGKSRKGKVEWNE